MMSLRGSALVLGATLALGLAPTARADMFKPSAQDQISLGQKAATQVRKEEKVLPETDAKSREVKKIGDALVATIPANERKKTGFKYSFEVVDSKEVNAFALPGGPIFVYTGLLDKLTTEDQIAGVLAHEITHARREHWANAYADSMKRQLGITALLVIFRANRTMADVASIGNDVIFSLPYSRKNENEADSMGFDSMVAAGYNPVGMLETFKILMKEGGSNKNMEWASTHPDNANRIKKVEQRIAKAGKLFPPEKPREK